MTTNPSAKCHYCSRQASEQSILLTKGTVRTRTLQTIRNLRLRTPLCSKCYNKATSGQSPSTEHPPSFLVMKAAEGLCSGLRKKLSTKDLRVASALRDSLNEISEQYDSVWLAVQQRIDFISAEIGAVKRQARVAIAEDVRRLNAASRALFQAREKISRVIQIEYDEARRAANAFIKKEWVRGHVFRRAGWKCEACGSEGVVEIDHIIPVIRGGENILENLQALCRPCNAMKGDKQPRRKSVAVFGH